MKKFIVILSGFIFIFAACVPKRDLIGEQKRVKELQGDSSSTHSSLSDCNSQVSVLQKDKADLQNSVNSLEASYQSSSMTVAQQEKRLKDLEGLIQKQKGIMDNLKNTIANALINFKPDELRVYLKDGNLYVSLQDKLLFPTGSAVVSTDGKNALKTLAAVLINTPNITIDVVGNTDTVPITGRYEDNWALSVARATSVSRILINDYGVDPHSIIASGRSKYLPVATNLTPEGRAENRRTDIILTPDLTELFKLLNE